MQTFITVYLILGLLMVVLVGGISSGILKKENKTLTWIQGLKIVLFLAGVGLIWPLVIVYKLGQSLSEHTSENKMQGGNQ